MNQSFDDFPTVIWVKCGLKMFVFECTIDSSKMLLGGYVSISVADENVHCRTTSEIRHWFAFKVKMQTFCLDANGAGCL